MTCHLPFISRYGRPYVTLHFTLMPHRTNQSINQSFNSSLGWSVDQLGNKSINRRKQWITLTASINFAKDALFRVYDWGCSLYEPLRVRIIFIIAYLIRTTTCMSVKQPPPPHNNDYDSSRRIPRTKHHHIHMGGKPPQTKITLLVESDTKNVFG